MKRARCASGAYVIYGKRGTRVGQSKCVERRVEEVLRAYGGCIGNVKKVAIVPALNKRQRIKMERTLINRIRPKCNPIKR